MALQKGWRWCNKCQGLFFAGGASRGICPTDHAPHDATGSGKYVLHHQSSPMPGQGDWMWCAKCQGIFFAGGGNVGVCPAGARGHSSIEGGHYVLLDSTRGKGQHGWRWCATCQGLFFSGNGDGVCPANRGHSSAGSGNYVLLREEDAGFRPSTLTLDPQDPLAGVRGAAAQGQTWVNVHSPFGILGQVFFPTDVHKLDDADQAELEKIVIAYQQVFNSRRVHLAFHGHADHRFTGTTAQAREHNLKLSEQRALSVRDFLLEQWFLTLPPHKNLSTTVLGYGGHPESKFFPSTSEALAGFRRTDILGPPIIRTPPPPVTVPVPPKTSKAWRARMLVAGSADIPKIHKGAEADVFLMDIQDLQNNLQMRFIYSGVGLGVGTAAGVDQGTDWKNFETTRPIRLTDFAGWARHTSAQFQISAGPSVDYVNLLAPLHRGVAEDVYLEFVDPFEAPGLNLGIGMGTSFGFFDPVGPARPF